MRTELNSVLALINHIASAWHGRVSSAQQVHETANAREYQICVDVRDNTMIAGREKLTPMISHIRTACAQFSDITIKATYYRPIHEYHTHQQYFTIKQNDQQATPAHGEVLSDVRANNATNNAKQGRDKSND